ncbi:MAG TPA: FAD-binding oxidoreductase [Kiloniellales bacterium]
MPVRRAAVRGANLLPDASFDPWWWEALPAPEPDEAPLPRQCDMAIVGGGYTGLSAALTLARAGRSVLVFEAGPIGHGASTRNGGMIGSGHRLGFAALAARLGRPAAVAIFRDGLASLDFAATLIEGEGIDCHFTRCGRFRAAWRPRDYDSLGREVDVLRREIGLEAAVVPKSEQHREVRTDCYHGGVVYHRHGALHPALFHAGLLARARAAGARIADHCPVTAITRESGGFALATARARVAAREVIVATNGYTGAESPALRRRLVPLSSYMIATEPLPAATVANLIPGGRMIVETRSRHCYYRASPDGRRILFGGRAALSAIGPQPAAARLRKLLVQVFPTMTETRFSHSWSGRIAFPRDQMPHIGTVDGIYYALGYSGSGVAMAPYLGHKVALKVLGSDEGRTAFDEVPFRPIPFHRGRPWFLPLLDVGYRIRDRMEGSD